MIRPPVASRAVAFACLIAVVVQASGCSTISKHGIDQEYYLIEPGLANVQKAPYKCVGDDMPPADIEISDRAVYIYADCVEKMLRRRMNLARIARLTSSTFAVLTAAAAAALGATAAAPLTAITALAASSAVIPEFMRIFGADERARAYEEGTKLIGTARGVFLTARVEAREKSDAMPAVDLIPTKDLTQDGANFYLAVVTSIQIVEQLLVAQLPTTEDIEKAQGKAGQKIKAAQSTLTVTRAGSFDDVTPTRDWSATLVVSGGTPPYTVTPSAATITAVPQNSNPSVFSLTFAKDKDPEPMTTYTLTVSDNAKPSLKQDVSIRTGTESPKLVLDGGTLPTSPGSSVTLLIEGGSPPFVVLKPTGGLSTSPSPETPPFKSPRVTVTVPKDAIAGDYDVTLRDGKNREAKATIRVQIKPQATSAVETPSKADIQEQLKNKDFVKKLQNALLAKGISVGPSGTDGIYGDNTRAAVRQFEKKLGLPESDVPDAVVLDKLGISTSKPGL
jgi:hypothetical protein